MRSSTFRAQSCIVQGEGLENRQPFGLPLRTLTDTAYLRDPEGIHVLQLCQFSRALNELLLIVRHFFQFQWSRAWRCSPGIESRSMTTSTLLRPRQYHSARHGCGALAARGARSTSFGPINHRSQLGEQAVSYRVGAGVGAGGVAGEAGAAGRWTVTPNGGAAGTDAPGRCAGAPEIAAVAGSGTMGSSASF